MNGYAKIQRADPCVLELVSRLAREPWTDRPACVHPVLGAVARAAHDHSTSAGRRELLPLAPRFLDTNRVGFEPSARLVALCVSTALTNGELTTDERHRLTAANQTAQHLLGTQDGPGGAARWWLPVLSRLNWSEPFYRTCVATEHVAEAVAITARAANPDVRLRSLLKLCLATQPKPSCSASAQKSWS
ncbi:hypothetical protein [Kribbella sp. C-35]|uniref:hypothetical protein n=1 Tax=Kribbella sp. C-35 TaxID=2789276 RepID=UPI003979A05B